MNLFKSNFYIRGLKRHNIDTESKLCYNNQVVLQNITYFKWWIMKSVSIAAPAKINLFLEVIERLPDGYHLLNSIMQSVDLCDNVVIALNESGEFTVKCPDFIGKHEDNLAIKAAKAFYSESENVKFSGVHIEIEKNIPMCAGMAGGSADAAAVLNGLNRLHDYVYSEKQLCKMGKKIGADVPYCIINRTSLAEGIGEILTPVIPLPDCFIVVAIGQERVYTKWAFEELDKKQNRTVRNISRSLDALQSGDLRKIGEELYNVFQTVSPHSEEIKKIMAKYDACGILMSGSGPSVFALYDSESKAEAACSSLKENGFSSYLCHPYKCER